MHPLAVSSCSSIAPLPSQACAHARKAYAGAGAARLLRIIRLLHHPPPLGIGLCGRRLATKTLSRWVGRGPLLTGPYVCVCGARKTNATPTAQSREARASKHLLASWTRAAHSPARGGEVGTSRH